MQFLIDKALVSQLKLVPSFINSLTKKKREMDSQVGLPRLNGLKYTLAAGLMLLTTDALFAQSAGQSDVDALKAQMNQMQRQYEQRIEAMEGKMKALESNANSGSILNARVMTDADGKEMPGKAPAPMLDESFLKSLTRNFSFNVYVRAGFQFNGSSRFNERVPPKLCETSVAAGMPRISAPIQKPGVAVGELNWMTVKVWSACGAASASRSKAHCR